MNFKLSNIPGNSVYIKIDKMNDGHLGLNSFRLDFGHGKIQSLIRRDYERFQSKPACCIRALRERRREKRRLLKADAPHITVTYCLLHRHALVTITFTPKLEEVLKIVVEYVSAPQPFLTCDTLIKLAKFGDTPQQTTLVKTQIMQKTIGIYSRTSMRNFWLF